MADGVPPIPNLIQLCTAPQATLDACLRPLLNPVPRSLQPTAGRPAAVLLAFQWQADSWHVIMTERARHLSNHAGQISFPGGKVDANDASLTATALREAEEEIALPPDLVEILGALDTVTSPVGFVVQPIVGRVTASAGAVPLMPAPDEVEQILSFPVSHVLDQAHHRQDSYLRDGQRRDVWIIDHPDHYLWGMSARILVDLSQRLIAHSTR